MNVEQSIVQKKGLEHDRRWMLVDADGRFLTQRNLPVLSQIGVTVASEGLDFSLPGQEDFHVRQPENHRMVEKVVIWKDRVDAVPADEETHARFSDFLGKKTRLVFMPEHSIREVDPAYGADGDDVSFADGYPILLISSASLDDLNIRLNQPVPMNRFRPNLVISGCEPYEEDGWSRIRIGPTSFRVVKPCARCVITTIDQQTGIAGTEPLRTLAAYRNWNGKAIFGQNLVPDDPVGAVIRRGDEVMVES